MASHRHGEGTVPATLGGRLRWLRKACGLSCRQLNQLAGRSKNHAQRIEAQPSAPVQTDTLTDYADVFGVSLDWLVRGVGPAPQVEDVQRAAAAARARRVAA